ncbi:MAG: hypothetical protein BWK80_09700 [Desulfobacteraceae bacterium IS3]|nr:MAG: hypothetical protein BWK80_09700 [Desulfobacteraceae bacterium IS3]
MVDLNSLMTSLGGFTLVGSFLMGLLANFTTQKINKVYEDFSKKNKFINHDLQRAVKQSFLRAIKAIASECLEKAKLSRTDMKWLEHKQAEVKDALKQLEKTEFPDMPLESLGEIELLFKPSGSMATEQFLQIVEEKLIAEALKDDAAAPESYKEKIRSDLFKQMCNYFAWEIKNTPEVRSIFDSQMLAQIDVRLIELGSTVDEAKEAVYEVKQAVKEIKEILCPPKTETIASGENPMPENLLEMIGGAMPLDSKFYVKRPLRFRGGTALCCSKAHGRSAKLPCWRVECRKPVTPAFRSY